MNHGVIIIHVNQSQSVHPYYRTQIYTDFLNLPEILTNGAEADMTARICFLILLCQLFKNLISWCSGPHQERELRDGSLIGSNLRLCTKVSNGFPPWRSGLRGWYYDLCIVVRITYAILLVINPGVV